MKTKVYLKPREVMPQVCIRVKRVPVFLLIQAERVEAEGSP